MTKGRYLIPDLCSSWEHIDTSLEDSHMTDAESRSTSLWQHLSAFIRKICTSSCSIWGGLPHCCFAAVAETARPGTLVLVRSNIAMSCTGQMLLSFIKGGDLQVRKASRPDWSGRHCDDRSISIEFPCSRYSVCRHSTTALQCSLGNTD